MKETKKIRFKGYARGIIYKGPESIIPDDISILLSGAYMVLSRHRHAFRFFWGPYHDSVSIWFCFDGSTHFNGE